jgi:hypothetical protein
MPAGEASHLLETLHRDQRREWFTLALDDELIMAERDPIQHVPDALTHLHGGDLVNHSNDDSWSMPVSDSSRATISEASPSSAIRFHSSV